MSWRSNGITIDFEDIDTEKARGIAVAGVNDILTEVSLQQRVESIEAEIEKDRKAKGGG